jgi:exopolysaccharide biosynthesis predicted pyruvyltransferase EpsI
MENSKTEMNMPEAPYEGLLKKLRQIQPFLYFPSSGNGGDALIAHATFEFFRVHGLEYELYSEKKFQRIKRVVIGGGGGFVDGYRKMAELVRYLHRDAEHVLILPSSCNGYEDTLRLMDQRFCFFARESVTASHLGAHVSGCEVMMCHDMALTLRPENFRPLEMIPLFLDGQPLDYQLKWLIKRNNLMQLMQRIPSETSMLRVDGESTRAEGLFLDDNYDVSHLIKGKMDFPNRAAAIADVFYHVISSQRSIVSDRLHVSICAAIAGIPCTMKANNYHKNLAIYHESIKSLFSSVVFSEEAD